MSNETDKPEFWKERLEGVEKRLEPLHFSIYMEANIKRIDDAHRETIDFFIPLDAKVLDVGCGYGRTSEWFKNYTGVDFAPVFIERAVKMFPRKNFVQSSFYKMPFKDGEFDWAVSIGCKKMVVTREGEDQWKKCVEEMRRVAQYALILEMGDPDDYQIL